MRNVLLQVLAAALVAPLVLANISACTHAPVAAPDTRLAASSAPLSASATQPSDRTALADPANAREIARMVDEPTRRVVRLANGLTIIIQENHTAPAVACRIYVKAGSLTEQQYMGAGISHVLEHLVAGASSADRKEKESKQLLRTIGNDSNAYTSFNQTCYFITTTGEKWPIAMDLLSDWVTNADFTEAEFQREYKVVQREIEMGEAEAGRSFSKLTYANRYIVSPAGIPVIGYKTAFQKLTRQDCQNYYNEMYVPDNMVVSVAGDLKLDDAQRFIAEKFSHVKRKKVPAIANPAEPDVTAPRTVVGHADVKQARVEWAFPTVSMYSPDLYALDVLANILGQGESSPLIQDLRDQKGLVTSIEAYSDTPEFAPGSFSIMAELPAENIAGARAAVLERIDDVIAHPIDDAQLEKAHNQMAAELVYQDQTAEQQAEHNASDYLSTGNIDFSRLYVQHIKEVTAQQVHDAAVKYLKPQFLLTTVLLPLNTRESVAAAGPATTQAATQPVVQKIVLDNGLTVLLHKNTSSPVVAMNYYVQGGLLAEDEKKSGIGNAMMHLITRGAADQSAQQIAQFFDSTGGTISATAGNNTFGVSATCLQEHAQNTFNEFAAICLKPAFPQQELDRVRPLLLAAIQHATEDWFGQGYALIRQSFYEQSPYKRLPSGSADVVGALTRDQIADHYRQYFCNPQHAVLAIYGDIDPEQVGQWVKSFAAMPQSNARLAEVSTDAAARTVDEKSNKQSATVFAAYGPGMVLNDPDRYAMTVLQTILGGYSYPGGWLFDTLRGQGLVYVVQATNVPGPVKGMFLIAALGEPENMTKIRTVIEAKVADARAGKFTDQEIQTAQDQVITSESLSGQTIAEQASMQALDELFGLGFDARSKLPAAIRAVTRDDLVRVANKYLNNPVFAITAPAEAQP